MAFEKTAGGVISGGETSVGEPGGDNTAALMCHVQFKMFLNLLFF